MNISSEIEPLDLFGDWYNCDSNTSNTEFNYCVPVSDCQYVVLRDSSSVSDCSIIPSKKRKQKRRQKGRAIWVKMTHNNLFITQSVTVGHDYKKAARTCTNPFRRKIVGTTRKYISHNVYTIARDPDDGITLCSLSCSPRKSRGPSPTYV